MRKINFSEIISPQEYEKRRKTLLEHITNLREKLKVRVGSQILIVFENRDTLLFQIQEILRTEQILSDDEIKYEIDAYNELIPEKNEIAATLFVEVDDIRSLCQSLNRLVGLDKGKYLYLQVDDKFKIYAEFEKENYKENLISTIYFIKFKLKPEEIEEIKNLDNELKIVIEHPNYKSYAIISKETREELISELESD